VFVLGHLGIGAWLARPWTRGGQLRLVLLGALLPDLIDKPLYYGLSWATGLQGAALGLISSTRTFGHTALFALAVLGALWSRGGAAIALGMATHLVLDLGGDAVALLVPSAPPRAGPPTLAAVLWPLLGLQFPVSPFKGVGEHLLAAGNAYNVAGEAVGALLLFRLWRRARRQERS
jgi:hypothetical protein